MSGVGRTGIRSHRAALLSLRRDHPSWVSQRNTRMLAVGRDPGAFTTACTIRLLVRRRTVGRILRPARRTWAAGAFVGARQPPPPPPPSLALLPWSSSHSEGARVKERARRLGIYMYVNLRSVSI